MFGANANCVRPRSAGREVMSHDIVDRGGNCAELQTTFSRFDIDEIHSGGTYKPSYKSVHGLAVERTRAVNLLENAVL